MKHRVLNPRFGQIYFAKVGRKYFYRTTGNSIVEILEEPFETWVNANHQFYQDHQKNNMPADLTQKNWEKFSFEQFKTKFNKVPIFLDEEQKLKYLKDKKIKNYLIRKQRIMNGGYRD